jgi:hypothetical protein
MERWRDSRGKFWISRAKYGIILRVDIRFIPEAAGVEGAKEGAWEAADPPPLASTLPCESLHAFLQLLKFRRFVSHVWEGAWEAAVGRCRPCR